MLASVSVKGLWLSFVIGWICKKLVVKYGGKATFDRVRLFFVGLLVGELVSYSISHILSMILGVRLGVQQ